MENRRPWLTAGQGNEEWQCDHDNKVGDRPCDNGQSERQRNACTRDRSRDATGRLTAVPSRHCQTTTPLSESSPGLSGLAEYADRLLLPQNLRPARVRGSFATASKPAPHRVGREGNDDDGEQSRTSTEGERRMDLLNDQVNDLKYLSQNAITPLADTATFTPQSAVSPVSAVGHNSAQQQQQQHHHQPQHHQPSSSSSDHNHTQSASGSGSKRKEIDDSSSSKQQRSKRNRYISIAW